MDDAHAVAVLDGSRQLAHHNAGLILRVLLLGYDAVKQLPTSHQLHHLFQQWPQTVMKPLTDPRVSDGCGWVRVDRRGGGMTPYGTQPTVATECRDTEPPLQPTPTHHPNRPPPPPPTHTLDDPPKLWAHRKGSGIGARETGGRHAPCRTPLGSRRSGAAAQCWGGPPVKSRHTQQMRQ